MRIPKEEVSVQERAQSSGASNRNSRHKERTVAIHKVAHGNEHIGASVILNDKVRKNEDGMAIRIQKVVEICPLCDRQIQLSDLIFNLTLKTVSSKCKCGLTIEFPVKPETQPSNQSRLKVVAQPRIPPKPVTLLRKREEEWSNRETRRGRECHHSLKEGRKPCTRRFVQNKYQLRSKYCKFYMQYNECHEPYCTKIHRLPADAGIRCWYGSSCQRRRCYFMHPPRPRRHL